MIIRWQHFSKSKRDCAARFYPPPLSRQLFCKTTSGPPEKCGKIFSKLFVRHSLFKRLHTYFCKRYWLPGFLTPRRYPTKLYSLTAVFRFVLKPELFEYFDKLNKLTLFVLQNLDNTFYASNVNKLAKVVLKKSLTWELTFITFKV